MWRDGSCLDTPESSCGVPYQFMATCFTTSRIDGLLQRGGHGRGERIADACSRKSPLKARAVVDADRFIDDSSSRHPRDPARDNLFLLRTQNVLHSATTRCGTRIGAYVVVALRIETPLGERKTGPPIRSGQKKCHCIKAWVRYVHRFAHAAADQKETTPRRYAR